MLAGGRGDVANARGELAFSLVRRVPGAIAGAAAVTRAVKTSAGTMQAHLPVFGLQSRRSALAAAAAAEPDTNNVHSLASHKVLLVPDQLINVMNVGYLWVPHLTSTDT